MRLLLLLSALLAALSGAGADARPLQVQVVAVSTRPAATVAVRAHAHVLAAAPTADVRAALAAMPEMAAPILAAPRLWADRRRE